MREGFAEQQFMKAYEELADPLFRHCFFRVSDREIAKDLVQETFTRGWKYVAEHGEVEYFSALLYRIVNNLIVDFYRQKKPVSLESPALENFEPSHDERIDRVVEGDERMVLELLEQLDQPYRDAVIYRYIDELSPKEIASLLGVTENVVSVRIHRGLVKLHELADHQEHEKN